MSFTNVYTHRKVAENAAKACEICYKPSTSVLVSSDNKDFFYVCAVHLKDRKFCSPIIDEAAVAAKKKKEMEAEVERVKKEYEERQKKKEKEKEEEKEKEKEKDKDKKDKKDEKDEKKSDEKKKSPSEEPSTPEEEPRVFALQNAFYQMRVNKKRSAEAARRNRERFQDPNLFPQAPTGDIGAKKSPES
ncbi:VPS4-associated protein 1 [Xylogone sp. PMI_703]|nr:VPS4-associated protein 1 [Xylogone sp. PMI_703]